MFLYIDDVLMIASLRNMSNVKIICFSQPNAFDLSGGVSWFFLKKDIDLFKDMVTKWN